MRSAADKTFRALGRCGRVCLGPEAPRGGGTIDSIGRSLYFPRRLIIHSGKYGRVMTMTIEDDRLSETFAALASSTRRAILARLAEGGATVNELAEPFEMT